MTREEAKELLIHVLMTYEPRDQYGDLDDSEPYEEAMTMAIEALSNADQHVQHVGSVDLISRQDALAEFIDDRDVFDIMESIESLPSAEPETKCIAQIRIDRDDMEDLINEKVNEIVDRMAEPKTGECRTCKRNADNGGVYEDGRTKCPIQEHYALLLDGYCHLYEQI